jgi:urease accessory protein
MDDGFLHPITGPDHLLAMVAVGIVAATATAARAVWVAPATFLGGMLLGGALGLAGVPMPGAELLIVASVVLLGLVVAGAVRDDHRGVVAGLVLAGVAHGHAHGAEAPSSAHPALYVLGFLVATAALHLAGTGVGTVIRERRLVRLGFGVATAGAGALLLL